MKYKFTGETKTHFGCTLHQIVCVTAFASIAAGDIGGWIEKEENLSQSGNAWVYGNAWVHGDARVSGNAQVSGDAWVSGNAWVLLGHHKVKEICILQIQGSAHSVCSPDGVIIKIGCQERTLQDWQENFESVGKSNGYTDAQIVEYKRYIDLFAAVLVERNN